MAAPLKKNAKTTDCQGLSLATNIAAVMIDVTSRKVLKHKYLANCSFLYMILAVLIQSILMPIGIPSLEINNMDSDQF